MEVGDWVGAAREAEEAVRFAEETGVALWAAAATIVKAKLAGMQGDLERSETHATHAERLVLSLGASFLLAMLQLARGIAAIGAGRHWEAYEHLRRLFAPADPAFNSGLQFFALADFVEAALFYSDQSQAARGMIDDVERVAAPTAAPWVETMLCYGKALVATDEDAERFFLQGLGPAANSWPFLRGRFLLGYGVWLRRQRPDLSTRGLRCAGGPRTFSTHSALRPGAIVRERSCEQPAKPAFAEASRLGRSWTPQELHIAQLAAQGNSNKVIGARLYLSHRTVGYHLHQIFSKTGITPDQGWGPFSPQPTARPLDLVCHRTGHSIDGGRPSAALPFRASPWGTVTSKEF